MKVLAVALATVVLAAAGVAGLGMKRMRSAFHPPRTVVLDTPVGVEDVVFTTEDGVKLRGWYWPSKNRAAVILGHGHGTNRAELLPEGTALAAAGFGVLLFDWRAHGESDGALVSFGFHEQKDLAAALKLVAARPDVDSARIGALGFSRGGTVLLQAAPAEPRLRALVVESTAATVRDGVCRDFGKGLLGCLPVSWAFALQGLDLDALRAVDRICAVAPRPVLLIHGTVDQATPVEDARRLHAAACGPNELWEIPGAGHGHFARVDGYLARVVAFFVKNL